MDVDEGTGNGGGTECSEALQCLKSDEVNIGIREMGVEEGTSNAGRTEFAEGLQSLKSDEVNNGVREGDVEVVQGTRNGGGAEFSETRQCLKSDIVNNGTREINVEEGRSIGACIEFSEAHECLKSDEVINRIREIDFEEGKGNGARIEFSEAHQCLKSDEVINRIREMDVEEGTSNGGGTELSEALHSLKSDEVNNGIREMDVEEGTQNGGGTEFSEVLQCLKSDEANHGIRFGVEADSAGSGLGLKSDEFNNGIRFGMKADVEGSSSDLKSNEANSGSVFRIGTDVAGSSSGQSEGLLTYKRRKRMKSSSESVLEDDGRAYAKGASHLVHQPLKDPQGVVLDCNSCEQICQPTDTVDGCSQSPWKIILEHMHQSLSDNEGGIQRYARDALESCTGIGSTKRAKVHDHHDENRKRCPSATWHLLNGFQKEACGHPGFLSNGNLDSLSHNNITDKCRHVCLDILISEKFTSLCKLLSDNFQGIKIDSFFDLNLINSRIKDGIYDNSPVLFLTDIQQVWEKLHGLGAEMISVAKNLSEISRSCYNKQFCTWGLDSETKLEREEGCSAYKACTCRKCGLKADGRDYLVCDSCEEMYHVSCIEPAVEEIPSKSWYCATCIANGIQSPHENCVVCERLNAPKSAIKAGYDSSFTNEEALNELGEDLEYGTDEEGFQPSQSSKILGQCKICGSEIQDCEKVKVCSNKGCPGGCYHVRCLSKKQLNSYGPGWYCPSCLCRKCFTDKDDDKIVLCDGCDHAYHIYCMKPERFSIPKGKWFCKSCDAKLDALRKAKRKFEKHENKQKKKANNGLGAFANFESKWNCKGIMESDKGGGAMEMLISAADTLNNEEKLAGILNKSCRK